MQEVPKCRLYNSERHQSDVEDRRLFPAINNLQAVRKALACNFNVLTLTLPGLCVRACKRQDNLWVERVRKTI